MSFIILPDDSKKYTGGGYTVTIGEDGAIKVQSGDWLSKYSMAIHGDLYQVNEYTRKKGENNFIPVENVNEITTGEILYHEPTRRLGESENPYPIKESLNPNVQKAIIRIMPSLNLIYSDWDFVSFNSAGGSGGIPVIPIEIGVTGGILKVKNQSLGQLSIRCVSTDVAVGANPIPFSANVSIPDTPGSGSIWRFRKGYNVTANSFRGDYVAITGAANIMAGIAATYIFMGSPHIRSSVVSPAIQMMQIFATSQVLVVALGITGNIHPDIGITVSLGRAV